MGNAEFCPLCGEITGGWDLPTQDHTCRATCSKCGHKEKLLKTGDIPYGWRYNDGTRVWRDQTELYCPRCWTQEH